MNANHERHLQATIEEELRLRGWRFYHSHDSRRSVAGFPDLVCLRGDRVLVAEIKGPKTRVTAEQRVARRVQGGRRRGVPVAIPGRLGAGRGGAPVSGGVNSTGLRLALSPEEAAAAVSLSRSQFYEVVLPELRTILVGRRRLVPVVELERWLEREARRMATIEQ